MMRLLVLMIALLPGCALSNALLGFPDFHTNQDACRAFDAAFVEAEAACTGSPPRALDPTTCPADLNDRGPACGELFACRKDSLFCTEDGFVGSNRPCDEEFPEACDVPFVDVFFVVGFAEGSCEGAGVRSLEAYQLAPSDGRDRALIGGGECFDGEVYRAFFAEAELPTRIVIEAFDVVVDSFSANPPPVAVSDEIALDEDDVEGRDGDRVIDLGTVTLHAAD